MTTFKDYTPRVSCRMVIQRLLGERNPMNSDAEDMNEVLENIREETDP